MQLKIKYNLILLLQLTILFDVSFVIQYAEERIYFGYVITVSIMYIIHRVISHTHIAGQLIYAHMHICTCL